MSDSCQHCECYGKLDLCERTDCFVRESWYSLQLQSMKDVQQSRIKDMESIIDRLHREAGYIKT
jgi:hypothetical protein